MDVSSGRISNLYAGTPNNRRVSRAFGAVVGIVTLISIGACMPSFHYRDKWVQALRDRAAFEFECPADEIHITALTETTFGSTNAPLNQGVTACGKRAVYTATISGYVLDSPKVDTVNSGADSTLPPPPTPLPAPPMPLYQ